MQLGNLRVVLGLRRLVARRHAAIDPLGGIKKLARLGDLFGIQDIRDGDQHKFSLTRLGMNSCAAQLFQPLLRHA